MIIPVRCISCGRVIAHLYDEYKKRTADGEEPKKVLDDLGVTNYCCRSHFMTHVESAKEIMKFKR